MKLYSTLDKGLVEVEPLKDNTISIYSCGPTVYSRMHVGNIRAYVNWDILQRALTYLGYDVKRVMNITDVGHMSSADDFGSDFGEDKVDMQSRETGLEPLDIANKYIDTVLDDFRSLNIQSPSGDEISSDLTHQDVSKYGFPRATEYIDEMIEIIKKIEENGNTYQTDQALYFDVTKISDYTIFTGQKLEEKEVASREEVDVDPQKKNPADFVLWMKKYGKYEDHLMNWDSPWGVGFPGWHIECSAMGTAQLGTSFDIHTGGIDHIPVHHTNERAQNIGAFGKPVVKYWVHNEWLVTPEDEKISKSKGLGSTLPEIVEQGYDPLDVRYLFASTNYRTRMQYNHDSLQGARNARQALVRRIQALGEEKGESLEEYVPRFKKELENNLNMSGVFGLINELLKSDHDKGDILSTILDFDKVLGLDLDKIAQKASSERGLYIEGMREEVGQLLESRKKAREEKNYELADSIRDEISKLGYTVLDTPEGQKVEKI